MFKSGFFKSVITLLQGSAGAQVIMVATYFVLARWYGPDSIGEIRNYTAIVLTVALLVNGGYELAIMLPKKSADALGLVSLSFRILIIFLAVLWPLGFFLREEIADILNSRAFGFWAILLPLSIFMEGLINLLHQYLVRAKRYRKLSMALLAYAIVYSVVALAGSWHHLNIHWLFGALFFAQTIKFLFYISAFFIEKKRTEAFKGSLKDLSKEFKDYPSYHLGSGLANQASREMVAPLLSSFFGSGASALYGTTLQILNLPMRFLSQAVPQVFYQRVAKAKELGEKHVKRETLNVLYFMLLVSAIPTFILAVFGPDLFAWALGEKWRASGEFVKWLGAFAVVGSVASPLTSLINVNLKLKSFFLFNILLLVSRLGAIVLGAQFGGAEVSIAFYGWMALAGALVLLFWMLKLAGIIKLKSNV